MPLNLKNLQPSIFDYNTTDDSVTEDVKKDLIALLKDFYKNNPNLIMTYDSGEYQTNLIPITLDVDDFERLNIQEKNIKTIFATLFLERPSQRIIVLGPGGERLKKIGIKARREIELVTGKQVFLNLHISIEKEWQRNPRSLEKFGF